MEQTKKCEICGEIKSASEFSKSYKHRCKECVAEQTRLARAEVVKEATHAVHKEDRPFRKAVVKDTDETVMVRMCREPLTVRMAQYETAEGRKFPMFALEYEKEIDWEQRRYDIAKAALQGYCASLNNGERYEVLAEQSVYCANALIAELKKECING